jgi:predicted metal-dependent hydrolase
MRRCINLNGTTSEFILKTSIRSTRISIAISRETGLIVTAPASVSNNALEKFFNEKAKWILKTQARLKALGPSLLPTAKRGDYARYKQQAQALAAKRVAYWSQQYGFRVNSISIRNQKTRWGSCSRKRNLNFSYKIALLPQAHADYIIVHEICHLKEMNHSPRFWALVEKTIPNHKVLRKQLRTNSLT